MKHSSVSSVLRSGPGTDLVSVPISFIFGELSRVFPPSRSAAIRLQRGRRGRSRCKARYNMLVEISTNRPTDLVI